MNSLVFLSFVLEERMRCNVIGLRRMLLFFCVGFVSVGLGYVECNCYYVYLI